MKTLKGRVVVLTGAAGGIGRATAHRLAADGARMALVDRDAVGLSELRESLHGESVSTHRVDLQDVDAFDALVHEVAAEHGEVHVLVNNAGLTVHGAFADHSREELDRVLDIDLRAVVHLTHAFLPLLRKSPPGHVVNVASMAGLQGFPFQTTYSAAKFALRGFGQALRPELAMYGIGVTTMLPGTVATGFMTQAETHDAKTSKELGRLMSRYGTPPERVAKALRRGVMRDRAEVRVGWDCTAMAFAQWLCPPLVPWVLATAMRRGLFGAAS